MPGFLQKLFGGGQGPGPEIWDCDPLVVVHAEDGVAFAAKIQAEYLADDPTGQSGHIRSLTPKENGWCPQLRFTQRVEMLQTFDVRVQSRPGLILIGQDETGEPFSWYINGEADRFLTQSSSSLGAAPAWDADEAAKVLTIPVDRATSRADGPRRLKIVRIDGYCAFDASTQLLRYPGVQPPLVEFIESLTADEDGAFPALYVLKDADGVLSGIGQDGIPTTWYLDEAADNS